MRLAASVPAPDDLQSIIKSRFQEFNRRSSPSRGRKYPNDLRNLVQRGIAAGIPPADLKRLTGMSQTAIRYARTKAQTAKPRRLEVVGMALVQLASRPLVIRLPSGISIELSDTAMLTPVLKAAQGSLEVAHASSL